MKIWPNMEQRTEEWFRARAGRLTASNFGRLLTPKTGKDSSQWEALAIELCCSCIRPDEVQWEGNFHTDRGEALEPEARELFARTMELVVEQVGFVTKDDNPVIGCSPDALVKLDGRYAGGLEIKCPLAKNHARYILDGVVPDEYKAQVHGSMVVTGLPCWYFMSYCPGFPPFIRLVPWDAYTDKLADALDRFTIYYSEIRSRIMPVLTRKEAI
ncbi:YqaJ viral recombinase family protein [Akkermansia sp. N21116]|uniref:lambda exonuclease family protein n=1 Tax=Akkermansia sp. N21116 TaxID=3040764 RepID=UPI00244EED5C|nr:lambda exonuclease family protein [Akkermansia sp. N21116]WPX40142.1 YqaJ viral recombinase family protein [Akkermansia sp. N21116]